MIDTNISAVFEELPPTPPVEQPSAPMAPTLPTEPPPVPIKKPIPWLPIGIGSVIVIAAISAVAFFTQRQTEAPITQITPTAIPSPFKPSRLSAIASTSAFAAFDTALATLSASINAFSLSDGTLNPPAQDIDLGITL